MRHEIDHTEQLIARELGYRPYLFRPPYGASGKKVRAYLADNSYTEVRWSIDVGDWNRRRSSSVRRRVGEAIVARQGGVVLLHDTKPWTVDQLPGILDDLEAENCRRHATGEPLLVPASLDFFIYERTGEPRPVPPTARADADAYVAALPDRCARRQSVLDAQPRAE